MQKELLKQRDEELLVHVQLFLVVLALLELLALLEVDLVQ
jgi:hypothetical protein